MIFQFPPTFSDLLQSKSHSAQIYNVTGQNPVLGLDDRIKKLHLREFGDAFNINNQIIQENERFDFLYYLIRDIGVKFDSSFYFQVLDLLQHQLQKIMSQYEQNENQFNQSFQMTLFLILNLLPMNTKKVQPSQLQQQPQVTGKTCANNNQALKKSLKVILSILSNKFAIESLQKDSIHYFYDLILLFNDVKENEIRELVIQTIMHSINLWGSDSQHLKTLIINLVYENESVVVPISQLLQRCYQKEEVHYKQFMNDMIQLLISYISEPKNNSSVENQASKNLRDILEKTSKNVPKYFYANLSNLKNLYDNENYQMRNALTEILTNVVEYLVLDKDNKDNDIALKQRDNLINTLISRKHDKVALARSTVLTSFSYLLKKNCVPKSFLDDILTMAKDRIKDISGWVRKAAIHTIKLIVKQYRQLFVESQGQSKFMSLETIEQLLYNNQVELEEIQNNYQQVKTEFDCRTEENSLYFQEKMVTIDKETDRIIKSKEYLEEYKIFMSKIKNIIHPISLLMSSRNQGDVIQSIKLIAYMCKFQVEGYEKGLKKIILLVWNQDKITKQVSIKQFWKLFLNHERYSVHQIYTSLLQLYQRGDNSIEASMNQILVCFLSEDSEQKLHPQLFNYVWKQILQNYKSQDFDKNTLQAQLLIVKVFFQQQPTLLSEDYVFVLLDLLSLHKKVNLVQINSLYPLWAIIRETCLILQLSSERNVVRCIKIALLILFQNFGSSDTQWFQVSEVVLNLVTKCSKPEKFYEFFIKKMAANMVLDKTEYKNIKIEVQLNQDDTPDQSQDEMELEQIEDQSSDDAHYKYSQLLFSIGHISIKILTHIDSMVYDLKIIKSNQEGKTKEQTNQNQQQIELDKIAGGHEAEYYKSIDLLQEITEKKILQQNMIAAFIPFVLSITKAILLSQTIQSKQSKKDRSQHQNSLLEKVCILTLCKFMCISEEFCTDHLQTLFQLLKCENVDYAIKNNIIISLGDLLHRFPNTVQDYHKQIYANLYDKNSSVRKTTLLVLTHLILNDMIKSKDSLSHIPILLHDPDPRIPSMAKYFLSELQKKDPRGILNSLPDLMGNLGQDKFEAIIPQIVPYLDKNHFDHLVERLLLIMAESEDIIEIKSSSLCISLLQLPIISYKKILDKWETIRMKFEDPYVKIQFKNLLKKQKRSQIVNPELKNLMEELELKIDNFGVETFESKRRVPEKSKRQAKADIVMNVEVALSKQAHTKQQIIPKIRQKITKKKRNSFVQEVSQTQDDENNSSMDLEVSGYSIGLEQRPKIPLRRAKQQQRVIESSNEDD